MSDASAAPVVVVLKQEASPEEHDRVLKVVGELSSGACVVRGDAWTAVALGDGTRTIDLDPLATLDAVDRIVPVQAPFRLASREAFERDTVVHVEPRTNGASHPAFEVGGGAPIAVVAGVGAFVGSQDGLLSVARSIKEAGGGLLYAGRFHAWAPGRDRTGLPLDGAQVREVVDDVGLAVCMEVSDPRDVEAASAVADVLQVGSESMQDFNLLRALGRTTRPVIVRRGLGATIEEFLLAAEYVLSYGNGRVILCESGIRTFDVTDRPRFEINAIAVLRQATHLPLIADPSRASWLDPVIPSVARAAIAAGADGLAVELREEPSQSSDGGIRVSELARLIADLDPVAEVLGRSRSREVVRVGETAGVPMETHEQHALYNAAVDLLERNLEPGRAERPYLRTMHRDWSYQEIAEGADAAGAGLLDIGLEQGDRVLLALGDCPEFVMTFWGAMKTGLIPVPIPQGLSASELRFIATDSEARAIVSDESSASAALSVLDDGGRIGLLVGSGIPEQPAFAWDAICTKPTRLTAASTTADEVAFWLYTAGTGGLPKAVMHRHGSLKVASAGLSDKVIHLEPDDVVLSIPRMSFAYGLGNSVYLPASVGACSFITGGPIVPAGVQEVLRHAKPTVVFGVPVFYSGFLGMPEAQVPRSVRIAISSAESLPVDVFHRFRDRFGLPLLDGLGSTEAMHHVTSNTVADVVAGSLGRPIPGYRVQVLDRDQQPVAEGHMGELWVHGPTTFAGYWRRPELSQDVYRDGWMRTGDLARVVDGRVYHEGRLDAMMKLGGMWVAPREIEDVLRSHEDIDDAAVVGVDEGTGVPFIEAFVVSERREPELIAELMAVCRRRLARFETPRSIQVVSELPPSSTVKILRAPRVRGQETDRSS